MQRYFHAVVKRNKEENKEEKKNEKEKDVRLSFVSSHNGLDEIAYLA